MNIALFNTEITIQKNTAVTDSIGNHRSEWTDWYSCHATVSGENSSSMGSESADSGTINDHTGVDFTVRFCSAVSAVTTTEYRVLFGGEIYDIIGIDHMNNKRKSIKLRCRKVRRSQ